MEQHWLSAIVPNYNDSALLPRAVDALTRQDPAPDEILVIDDGSTDDSLEIVEGMLEAVPSLRVIRNPRNLGVIRALNLGLEAARGRYVYLGSANDSVEPGFFAVARRMLDAHPQAGLFCAECRVVDTEGNRLSIRPAARPASTSNYFPPEKVIDLFRSVDNFVHSSTAVVRRDAAESAGFLRPELGSFADGYLMRWLALRYGFCFAPIVAASWTFNPAGVSLNTANRPETTLALLGRALSAMKDDHLVPEQYLELFDRRWRFAVGRLAAIGEPGSASRAEPVVARTAEDRAVWRLLSRIPGAAGRVTRLAWLVMRFRPYRLTPLVRTQVSRVLEDFRGEAGFLRLHGERGGKAARVGSVSERS